VPTATLLICLAFGAAELRAGLACFRGRKVLAEDGTLIVEPASAIPTLRARPLMFAFLFSWALPLSFVPLYARALPAAFLDLPASWIMAVPISAEMFCAFVSASFAGAMADRRGWDEPVLLGLAGSGIGALLCAWAPNVETFIFARAVTGFAYGLAWVGIQSFVVRHTRPEALTFGVANLTAGIFTGHLLGAVTGGWIADMAGYRAVFLVVSVAAAVPALYLVFALGSAMGAPAASSRRSAASASGVNFWAVLGNRDFVALLLGSVIPFSIAQVGLLYYAVPILLGSFGASTAEVGQVIAIYSATLVFLAPAIARAIDKVRGKRLFIIIGGCLGSTALMMLFVAENAYVLVASTFLLGLASSIGGAANTSYALQFPEIRRFGVASVTGVQRAADKLGQMLGPLFIGGLFATVGLSEAVALAGVFYLVTTLIFLVCSHRFGGSRKKYASSPETPPF
jgi:MFS family permease